MPHSPESFAKISFSLPHDLLSMIDALAAADRRSRSSWIVIHLERLLEEATAPPAPPATPATPAKNLKPNTAAKKRG